MPLAFFWNNQFFKSGPIEDQILKACLKLSERPLPEDSRQIDAYSFEVEGSNRRAICYWS